MPRTTLIPATLDAATSGIMRIPSQRWSPDADLTKGTYFNPQTGTTTTNDYDGRELAPRSITILLHAGHGHELPADARLVLETRVYDEISGEGSPGGEGQPEQWEEFAVLTPTRKLYSLNFPIEDVRVRKDESETPYGAIGFGLYGNSPGTQV